MIAFVEAHVDKDVTWSVLTTIIDDFFHPDRKSEEKNKAEKVTAWGNGFFAKFELYHTTMRPSSKNSSFNGGLRLKAFLNWCVKKGYSDNVSFRQVQTHGHVHIVYSRVDNDGSAIKGDCNFRALAAVTRLGRGSTFIVGSNSLQIIIYFLINFCIYCSFTYVGQWYAIVLQYPFIPD